MKILKIAVALGLLWFVFYGSIPSININPIPDEVDEVEEIINVEKPSEEIIAQVKPVADLVKETEDKAKLALFNYEFAERVKNYPSDVQQLNDVYTEAAKIFFGNTQANKYPGFSDGLLSLFKSVVSDENHVLTTDEKDALSNLFKGLTWALVEGS